jgi:hypothetical protein
MNFRLPTFARAVDDPRIAAPVAGHEGEIVNLQPLLLLIK